MYDKENYMLESVAGKYTLAGDLTEHSSQTSVYGFLLQS